MKIEKTLTDNGMTLKLEGRLDTVNSPKLKELLNETMDSIDSLTLDFEGVEYVSSAGLRVLLTAHNTMSKKNGLKIVHANEDIRDTLDVTGLLNILNVVRD